MEEKIKIFASKNIKIINILSIIVLIGLIIFLVYFFFSTNKESGKCMINPVGYYEERLNLTCSCVDDKGNIYGHNIKDLYKKSGEEYLLPNINFSELS